MILGTCSRLASNCAITPIAMTPATSNRSWVAAIYTAGKGAPTYKTPQVCLGVSRSLRAVEHHEDAADVQCHFLAALVLAPDVGRLDRLEEVLDDGVVVVEFGPFLADGGDPRVQFLGVLVEPVAGLLGAEVAIQQRLRAYVPNRLDVRERLVEVEVHRRAGHVDRVRRRGEDAGGIG